ncbi:MAG: amylo-alpha-1,6-glucosidase [Tannerellaceae bacterium]|jgi:predicted glycogen debranching enzyme|nr:amylo-alpha-1,6-glucosidase [Tannerellaceae bacterium]
MSYIKFDRSLMSNLEESLSREVLRTNRKGAYDCSTLSGCNTRKYHGLLVLPVPSLGEENYVLLSSLDETVIQHQAHFNLGVHKYAGGSFSPKGHKYIREYSLDVIPRSLYRVGGVILSKEKVFCSYENRILIKYTLLEAHSPTTLRFRPFLAFRSAKQLTYKNEHIDPSCQVIANGIKTCLYPGYPSLYMQFDKAAKFVGEADWYMGIEYPKEQERGYMYHEDLYAPGYFEVEVVQGDTVFFSAGDEPVDVGLIRERYETEVTERTPRDSFYNNLKNAAQQFYFRPNETDAYLLAGYPWFKVRARDLFVSLPGATLAIKDPVRFDKIMHTAEPALRRFMEAGEGDEVIKEIEQPDVLLWVLWAIQQYAQYEGLDATREKYASLMQDILDYLIAGKHPDILVHDNGLLYAEANGKAITWMNSTIDGHPVVYRSGYIVEFNALWYNALCFYKELTGVEVERFEGVIRSADEAFPRTFVNGYHYLFDSVYGDGRVDWSVRPNMIIAVALPYSPLTRSQRRAVLDYVTKELLIPKGLRSLSPKSEGYHPYYTGPQRDRDLAYHQGAAWPWLLGFYFEAYLRIFGRSGASFVERTLASMEEEMSLHCIGTISELFDGTPPFTGRGAISFSMSVSAMLRVVDLLKKYS